MNWLTNIIIILLFFNTSFVAAQTQVSGRLFDATENSIPWANNVRVQGGNPNSSYPAQQKPYVKQTKNGKTIDVNGKQVDSKSKEAHIPKEDFKFKKD